MKKSALSICVIVFVCFVSNVSLKSQTGWYWLQPSPTGNSLNCVSFLNKDTGIAAGKSGELIKTTDGGSNWFPLSSNIHSDLNKVCFINSAICIAAGKSGMILKSKDCGDSWSVISSGVNTDLFDMEFTDNSTGYAVGLSGTIIKTVSKGNYWFTQNSGSSLPLYCVKFLNENTGVAGGYNVILKTTNGGINWINLNVNISPAVRIAGIYLSDSMNIIAAGSSPSGDVYRSSDGGLNWIKHSMELPLLFGGSADLLKSISFLNRDTGFAVTSYGTILKTIDRGLNWQKDSAFRPGYDKTGIFENVFIYDINNIFISGGGGTVIKSSDCGNHWYIKSGCKNDITASYFLNGKTGYCAGEKGIIMKTNNNGFNWIIQDSETDFRLNTIYFSDYNIGFAAGENGIIMKTTDSGNIWSVQKSNTYGALKGIWFINAETGFAAGGNESNGSGLILKTTNGGEVWNSVYNVLFKGIFTSVCFVNSSNGYVCGRKGIILKTTDCGMSWTGENKIPFDLNSITFKDSLNGLVCGSDGAVYKTTDRGEKWNFTFSGVYKNLLSVRYGKNGKAIAAGEAGTVITSSNGGNSWIRQNTFTYNDLYSSFSDEFSATTVFGSFGTVMRYSETGSSFSYHKSPSDKPDGLLYQNFPNPFNPFTTIAYELRSPGKISLIVYDINGREVRELFSGFRNAGFYSTDFSGAGLPSGVYFFVLTASSQSFIRKMILLN